tara:strand:+ start:99 stop:1007 length:909 start_codon:yes stop_codon:yes gene_type:complete
MALPVHVQKLSDRLQRRWSTAFAKTQLRYTALPEDRRAMLATEVANATLMRKTAATDSEVVKLADLIEGLTQTRVEHSEKAAAEQVAENELVAALGNEVIQDISSWSELTPFAELTKTTERLERKPEAEWTVFDRLAWVTCGKAVANIVSTVEGLPAVEWLRDNVFVAEDPEPAAKSLDVTIIKAEDDDDEQRFVLGVVLVPDVQDLQDDIVSVDDVERAAHQFMLNKGCIGISHEDFPENACIVVESSVARQDLMFETLPVSKGSWMLGLKVISDDLWEQVKAGEFSGFSIGGEASRRQLA